jgi:hypothetical protein
VDDIEYCIKQVAQYDVEQGINHWIAVTTIHYNLGDMRKEWRDELVQYCATLSPEEKADLGYMALELKLIKLPLKDMLSSDPVSDSLHSDYGRRKRGKKQARTSILDKKLCIKG